jgi:hypothetical protein
MRLEAGQMAGLGERAGADDAEAEFGWSSHGAERRNEASGSRDGHATGFAV